MQYLIVQGNEDLQLKVVSHNKWKPSSVEQIITMRVACFVEKVAPASDLWQVMTINLDKRLHECAHTLSDGKLLAKLGAGDAIAQELKYRLAFAPIRTQTFSKSGRFCIGPGNPASATSRVQLTGAGKRLVRNGKSSAQPTPLLQRVVNTSLNVAGKSACCGSCKCYRFGMAWTALCSCKCEV